MKRNLALGVDIGGTNSVFGLCDEYGKLYFEESVSTTDYSTPEELVDKIYERIKSVGHLPNIEPLNSHQTLNGRGLFRSLDCLNTNSKSKQFLRMMQMQQL